jgi:hypothetical protein
MRLLDRNPVKSGSAVNDSTDEIKINFGGKDHEKIFSGTIERSV